MKWFITIFLTFAISAQANPKEKLDGVYKTQDKAQKTAQNSQTKINRLDDEAQNLLQEYRLTLKKIHNTKTYNQQLRDFIKKQQEEMISVRKQIEEVKDTGKDILPLITRMMESLETFIELDKPFLLEERKKRIANLKTIVERSDISVSEKYRRLLDIYDIENEYGQTISTYRGQQDIKGKDVTVDFLRVGRISLMYQSLDKKYQGYWNDNEKKWMKLPRTYKDSLSKGLLMAKKQSPPNLLKVPVSSPTMQKEVQ